MNGTGKLPVVPVPHCQEKSRRWTVQKFGGTSVGKFADKIANEIVRCIRQCLIPHRGTDDWVVEACRIAALLSFALPGVIAPRQKGPLIGKWTYGEQNIEPFTDGDGM